MLWATIAFVVLWVAWAGLVLISASLQHAATGGGDPVTWPILIGGAVIAFVVFGAYSIIITLANFFGG